MTGSLERLLRYERGACDEDEARALERELSADAEARAELAWIRALRAIASAPGDEDDAPANVDPIEVAALVEGTLPADRAHAVRAALAHSARGLDLLEAALAELRAADAEARVVAPPPEEPAGAPPALARWWLPLAAAAALLIYVLVPDDGEGGAPEIVAVREAIPVTTLRTGDSPFERGRAAYAAGDYAEAERALAEVEPGNGEALLYRGSALLLSGGREAEAVDSLRAARAATTGSFRDEATWQLAQALLATDAVEDARELLAELASGGGHRAADAARQLR